MLPIPHLGVHALGRSAFNPVRLAVEGCCTSERSWGWNGAWSRAEQPGEAASGVCIFPSFPHTVAHTKRVSFLQSIRETLAMYSELGKIKLGSMVVITTMAGYYMAPFSSFDLKRFALTSLGTGLAVISANTFNHIIEAKLDLRMVRTSTRPLPSGRMSSTHATMFGVITGIVGPALLMARVDNTAAALALANIVLYAGVYTPLKQMHPINTWVGSVVGAIPPMIGWVAVTKGKLDLGAWALGGLLFLWQIPHFLSLSFPLKEDYARAGYKMLSVTNVDAVMSLSYVFSAMLLPLGFVSSYAGMTSWVYAIDSTLCNGYLLWMAHKFYTRRDTTSARKLFFASLIYLPLQMSLMMLHKSNHPVSAAAVATPSLSL